MELGKAEAVERADRVGDLVDDLLDLVLVGGVDHRGQAEIILAPWSTHVGRRSVATAAGAPGRDAQPAAAGPGGRSQAEMP